MDESAQSSSSNAAADLSIPPVQDIGISELYVPRDLEPVADVVFVHGLMGHPVRSWLHGDMPDSASLKPRTEQKEKRRSIFSKFRHRSRSRDDRPATPEKASGSVESFCYWPYHLLRNDISDIRILTYGYDSSPTHWYKHKTNQMTITQHAEDLLFKVSMKRSECEGRPLIFVAHSLGGILVKAALNESRQMKYQRLQSDVLKCCHAVFFFGTPHLGATIASWGETVSNIVGSLPGSVSTYGEVLRGLSPDSETLYNITKRFNELLNEPVHPSEKIQICSIQEGQGISSIKGGGSKVVPDYSSKLNRSDIEQGFFIQNENHMDMCKFSSGRAPGYGDFVGVLRMYRRTISDTKAATQKDKAEISIADNAELLKTLNYSDRLDREHQLAGLHTTDESFEWVWTSNLVPWLQSDQSLFWIVGHPASGKSTLTNHISNNKKLMEVLEEYLESNAMVIRFFFDYRAHDSIRNTFSGLKRSLLYQILRESQSATNAVEHKFQLKKQEIYDWLGDDSQLTTILLHALKTLECRTLLFLDGLDEYKGENPDLIDLIDRLLSTGIKICLASRDEYVFRVRLRNEPCIRMDVVNRPGIEAYATKWLASSLDPNHEQEHRWIQRCSKQIAENSNGVFLWARFAVLEIIDKWGEDIIHARHEERAFKYDVLEEILNQLPPGLGRLYHRIFIGKDDNVKAAYGVIFQLITTASTRLQLSELYEACVIAKVYPPSASGKAGQHELAGFNRFVLAPGLLEAQSSVVNEGKFQRRRRQSLLVIHRTVNTYLEEQGWFLLLGETQLTQSRHTVWLRVLVAVLQGHGINWKREIEPHDNSKINSECRQEQEIRFLAFQQKGLTWYAETFLPVHAREFERESGNSSRGLIRTALSPSFLEAHRQSAFGVFSLQRGYSIYSKRKLIISFTTSVLHLAIYYELFYFVEQEILENSINPNLLETDEASMESFIVSRHGDTMEVAMDGPSLNLLEMAVIRSSIQPTPKLFLLIETLVDLSPRVSDECMLHAIRKAPFTVLKALLRQFPKGKLHFYSKIYPAGRLGRPTPKEKIDPSVKLGPLSEVAFRLWDKRWSDSSEVLDFFLERGEDINSQCAPFGGVVHSLIENIFSNLFSFDSSNPSEEIADMFGILISRGADIGASGPYGNAMELLCMLLDTKKWGIDLDEFDKDGSLPHCKLLIDFLTSKGLTNKYKNKTKIIRLVEDKLHTLEDDEMDTTL